jgi:hypothetical protein
MDGLSSEIINDILASIVDLTTNSGVSYPTRNFYNTSAYLNLTKIRDYSNYEGVTNRKL